MYVLVDVDVNVHVGVWSDLYASCTSLNHCDRLPMADLRVLVEALELEGKVELVQGTVRLGVLGTSEHRLLGCYVVLVSGRHCALPFGARDTKQPR